MVKRQKLGEYLLEKGLITEAQLRDVLDEQRHTGRPLGQILVARGFVSEEEVTKALAIQLRLEYVDLTDYKFLPEIIKFINQEQATRLGVIPLKRTADTLEVAMINPLDVAAIDELHLTTGLNIKPIFACPTAIKADIEKNFKVKEIEPQPVVKITKGEEQKISSLIEEATQESVVKTVDRIIKKAVELNASDIHLEPEEKELFVRFRIDGILHDIERLSKKQELTVISRIKIMADMDIAEKRLPQDGRIELKILDKDIDLRVATFPTLYGENVSIRILDKSTGLIKLDNLGFDALVLEKFEKVIRRPQGIILVTGPTGCGKTTTLYAALNAINDTKKNIITLEDPIEYAIPRVRQSQINVKAGLTFATGLRAIVRQDPDVIMIGEIRDRETADIAIHSALTGHLVFSTLHTNDASSSITRLIDMGVEPFLVASSITAILAQRLVRRVCEKCKKTYKLSQEEIENIQSYLPSKRKILQIKECFRESSCKQCNESGFKGRVGIFELLLPNEKIREEIIRKSSSQKIKELAIAEDMQTLFEDGLNKFLQGVTSLSEVLRVVQEE